MSSRRSYFTLLLVAASIVACCPLQAAAASRLHVLFACDTADPDLGEGFGLVNDRLLMTFTQNVSPKDLNVAFLNGAELTAKKLKAAIANVPAGAGDSLLVYLACHGNFDPSTGAFFRFSSDQSTVTRAQLTTVLKSRRLQFTALISDACNDYARYPLPQLAASDAGTRHAPLPEVKTQPAFRSLFLSQRGFLDLASSAEGEFAVYFNNYRELLPYKEKGQEPPLSLIQKVRHNRKGGVFSEAFKDFLISERNKPLTWQQLVPVVAAKTLQGYKKEVPDGKIMVQGFPKLQPAQTVTAIEMPKSTGDAINGTNNDSHRNSNNGTTNNTSSDAMSSVNRLGVRCRLQKGKLLVAKVDAGSVADDYRVEVGDVIKAINGAQAENLNSIAKLESQIKKASTFIRVVVVKANGKEQSFTAMLQN